MGEKVLVVDDNPAMVALLADALIEAGYVVISADNGKRGLALVESEKPDLVILDLMMPVMSGLQVLRTLRSAPATQYIPAIVLTGRNGQADALEAWMGGADRYLTKPCAIEELLSAVRDMLSASVFTGSAVAAQPGQGEEHG